MRIGKGLLQWTFRSFWVSNGYFPNNAPLPCWSKRKEAYDTLMDLRRGYTSNRNEARPALACTQVFWWFLQSF